MKKILTPLLVLLLAAFWLTRDQENRNPPQSRKDHKTFRGSSSDVRDTSKAKKLAETQPPEAVASKPANIPQPTESAFRNEHRVHTEVSTKHQEPIEIRLSHEPALKYPQIREEVYWDGRTLRMVADHLVVRLRDGASLEQVTGELKPLEAHIRRRLPLSGLILVAFDGKVPGKYEEVLNTLQARTDLVTYVEMDEIIRGTAFVPNDPLYAPDQWNLPLISAPDAWDITQGRSDVVIGIADSGIDYLHEDMIGQVWTNPGEIPGNGIDDDQNGFVDDVHGYDFVDEDGDPYDVFRRNDPNNTGHGTQQASIAAAAIDNSKGIAGIAPASKVMALRIMVATQNGPEGIRTDAVESLHYGAMMRNRGVNIRVSNHSWGGSAGNSEALEEAILANQQADMLVVVAAGNSGQDIDITGSVPASLPHPNIISVAATDASDALAGFSNTGVVGVDLAAPGVQIQSAINDETSHSKYALRNGTSPAAPHVAAAAALCFSVAPADATAADIKAAILNGVDTVPGLSGKVLTGGRLNLFNAVQNAQGTAGGPVILSATPEQQMDGQPFDRFTFLFDRDMDTSSFSLLDDIHSFTGPSGFLTATGFSWIGQRTLEITFAPQRASGTYTLELAPSILDASMNPMDQDVDGVTGEPGDDRFTASVTLNDIYGGPRVLEVVGSRSSGTLQSVGILFSEPVNPAGFPAGLLMLEDPAGKDLIPLITATQWEAGNRLMRVQLPAVSREGIFRVQVSPTVAASGDGVLLNQDQDETPGEASEDIADVEFLSLEGLHNRGNGYAAYAIQTPANLDLTEGDPGVSTAPIFGAAANVSMDLGGHQIQFFDHTYSGVLFPNSDFGLLALEQSFKTGNEDVGFESLPLKSQPQAAAIAPYWVSPNFYFYQSAQRQFALRDRNGDSLPDHLQVEWHYASFLGGDIQIQCMIQLNPGSNQSVITFSYPDLQTPGETFGNDVFDDPMDEARGASVGIRPDPTGIFTPELLDISFHDSANPLVQEGTTLEISKPGSIGGRVFSDDNNNGQWDVGEAGTSGRTVFLDTNGNDVLDAGEAQVVTDIEGWYAFGPLSWGTYDVRIVPGADSFFGPVERQVSLNDQQRITGMLFGLEGSVLAIQPHAIPPGESGNSYNLTLIPAGGTPGYSWSWKSGDPVPAGFTFSPQGILTGTPTISTPYRSEFVVEVEDGSADKATRLVTLIIADSENIGLADWKERNGVADQSNFADGEGDGLGLIFEHAFGGTLDGDDTDKLPSHNITPANVVRFSYYRRIGQDSYYTVESIDSLETGSWNPAGILDTLPVDQGNGFEKVTHEIDVDLTTTPLFFLRLFLGP